MNIKIGTLAVAIALAATAAIAQPPHEVRSGDTLWDISEEVKNNPWYWPILWSKNPQIHNPHWVFPGDIVYFDGIEKPAKKTARTVALYVEKLLPPEEVGAGEAVEAVQIKSDVSEFYEAFGLTNGQVRFAAEKSLDFITPGTMKKLGYVAPSMELKTIYAQGEEVEVRRADGLYAGQLVNIVNDARIVTHPITGRIVGRHVNVVAEAKVTEASGDKAKLELLQTFDAVEEGLGIIGYRRPYQLVELRGAPAGAGGMIIAGYRPFALFAEEDVVFLDKGRADGLEPGMLFEIPNVGASAKAEGYVADIDEPIARLVIIRAEETTASALILDSRKVVEAGLAFNATTTDSP